MVENRLAYKPIRTECDLQKILEEETSFTTTQLAEAYLYLLVRSRIQGCAINLKTLGQLMEKYPQALAPDHRCEKDLEDVRRYLQKRMPEPFFNQNSDKPMVIYLVNHLPPNPPKMRTSGRARWYSEENSGPKTIIYYHIRDANFSCSDQFEVLSWLSAYDILRQNSNLVGSKSKLDIQFINQANLPYENHEDDKNMASWQTTKLIRERLNGRKPCLALFGNDFSLRNMFRWALLDDHEQKILLNYFDNELKTVTEKYRGKPELVEFLNAYTAVSLLDLNKGNISIEIEAIRKKLINPDSFAALGIERLIHTKESPIADPIDYFDPKEIRPEIKDRFPELIKKLVNELCETSSSILSVPYALGDLAGQLFCNIYQELGDIELGFLGKIGALKTPESHLQVGDLVLPESVYSQYEEDPLEVNCSPISLLEYGLKFKKAAILTTSALTMQTSGEMCSLLKGTSNLGLDMELGLLIDKLKKNKLKPPLHLIYYVSDLTQAGPDEIDHDKKISNSLGIGGIAAVAIATYAIFRSCFKVS